MLKGNQYGAIIFLHNNRIHFKLNILRARSYGENLLFILTLPARELISCYFGGLFPRSLQILI